MFADEMLDVFKGQVAALGMTLFTIKYNGYMPDKLRENTLHDALRVCDFLISGQSLTEQTISDWMDAEVFRAFTILSEKLNTKGQDTLRQLCEEVKEAKDIILALLRYSAIEPTQLEKTMKFCHNLYWILALNV